MKRKNHARVKEVAEFIVSIVDDREQKSTEEWREIWGSKMGSSSGRKRAYRALAKNFFTCILRKTGMKHKDIADMMNINLARSKEYCSRFLENLSQDYPNGVFHPFYLKQSLMTSDHQVRKELLEYIYNTNISENLTIYDWLCQMKFVNSQRYIWIEDNRVMVDTETGEVLRDRKADVFDAIRDYIYEEDESDPEDGYIRIKNMFSW